MEFLKNEIYKLYDLTNIYNLEKYNNLIIECVKLHEMSAVVFLYDNMKYHKISPNKLTYSFIDKLHSKTIKENNNIHIKNQDVGKLKPRRRIHKIIKGYNYSDKYNDALKNLDKVKKYLTDNPDVKNFGRIKLAKNISDACSISFDDSRYIITNLKKTKFLSDNEHDNTYITLVPNEKFFIKNKKKNKQKKIDDFF